MNNNKEHTAEKGLVWTCCDPNGVTFCVGCGEDVQRGRTLPHRVLPPGKTNGES